MSTVGQSLTQLRPPPTTVIPEASAIIGGVYQFKIPGRAMLGTAAAAAIGANAIYYEPFIAPTPITIDRLAIEVTGAAVAGKIARLGIYKANINWQPTTLIVDAGTVLVDSNAVVAATVNTFLEAGRYVGAIASDSNPTLRRWSTELPNFATALGANGGIIQLLKAAVGAGALANPGVAWDTGTAFTGFFMNFILYRVSNP